MTSDTGVAPHNQAIARPSSRKIALAVLQVAGSVAALVALYYLLPLDRLSTSAAVTVLVIGLVAFITLVAAQVRWIIRSPLVRELKYDGAYPSFTRALRKRGLRPRCERCAAAGTSAEFAVIEHPAGEETQWDWVELPDPQSWWGVASPST